MNPVSQFGRKKTVLVIVDVQDSLMKQMNQEAGKKVIPNIQTLLAFAKKMAIRVLTTEQYPEGLGRGVPEIRTELEVSSPREALL